MMVCEWGATPVLVRREGAQMTHDEREGAQTTYDEWEGEMMVHTGGKGVYNQQIHCDLIVIF